MLFVALDEERRRFAVLPLVVKLFGAVENVACGAHGFGVAALGVRRRLAGLDRLAGLGGMLAAFLGLEVTPVGLVGFLAAVEVEEAFAHHDVDAVVEHGRGADLEVALERGEGLRVATPHAVALADVEDEDRLLVELEGLLKQAGGLRVVGRFVGFDPLRVDGVGSLRVAAVGRLVGCAALVVIAFAGKRSRGAERYCDEKGEAAYASCHIPCSCRLAPVGPATAFSRFLMCVPSLRCRRDLRRAAGGRERVPCSFLPRGGRRWLLCLYRPGGAGRPRPAC